MKTRNILITLGVAAMATANLMATEALLSPRGSDQQSKIVSGVNSDPNLAAPGLASASPRVLDNQTKTVAGKSTSASSSTASMRHMACSPKMMGACAGHSGDSMSCCSAPDKK